MMMIYYVESKNGYGEEWNWFESGEDGILLLLVFWCIDLVVVVIGIDDVGDQCYGDNYVQLFFDDFLVDIGSFDQYESQE